MKKLISFVLLALVLVSVTFAHPALAEDDAIIAGKKIFSANCAACHAGGNNAIVPTKNLKKESLEKYNMNSLEAIVNQVTKGKGAMPSFKGRLNSTQIEQVASYVLDQSEKGW